MTKELMLKVAVSGRDTVRKDSMAHLLSTMNVSFYFEQDPRDETRYQYVCYVGLDGNMGDWFYQWVNVDSENKLRVFKHGDTEINKVEIGNLRIPLDDASAERFDQLMNLIRGRFNLWVYEQEGTLADDFISLELVDFDPISGDVTG